MKKCLMLDVDGVLINGRPQDGMPWATSLEDDLQIGVERLQSAFFRPYWPDIVTGRMDIREALDRCLPSLHQNLTTDSFLQYWFESDARVDLDVLRECDKLRRQGVRVFLATNQEHLRARFIMQDLGMAKHVDGILYSAQIGARKPENAFFEAAAISAGVPVEQMILVDDTMENIRGMRAAGGIGLFWSGTRRLSDLLAPALET